MALFRTKQGNAWIHEQGGELRVHEVHATTSGELELVKALEQEALDRGCNELAFTIPGKQLLRTLIKRRKEGQHYHFRRDWWEELEEHYDVIYTTFPCVEQNEIERLCISLDAEEGFKRLTYFELVPGMNNYGVYFDSWVPEWKKETRI